MKHFRHIGKFSRTLLLLSPVWAAQALARPWTPEVSIGVRYYVNEPSTEGLPGFPNTSTEDRPASFSPDGSRFFVVSFSGDLNTDVTNYRLDVYETARVEVALAERSRTGQSHVAPIRSVQVGSAHSREDGAGIVTPKWIDANTITFIGSEGSASRKGYSFDVRGGSLNAIAGRTYPISSSNWIQSRYSVVYLSTREVPVQPFKNYPLTTIRGSEFSRLLEPMRISAVVGRWQDGPERVIVELEPGTRLYGPWISPDGRYAVAALSPKDLQKPSHWDLYEIPPTEGYRFVILDLENAEWHPVMDAPVGTVTKAGRGRKEPFGAIWSDDSKHVLIANTALPLEPGSKIEVDTPYIIDLDVTSQNWSVLQSLKGPSDSKTGGMFTLKEGQAVVVANRPFGRVGVKYSYGGLKWRESGSAEVPSIAPARTTISIITRESLNSPPRLFATDGRREIALTSPDPDLNGVRIASSTIFSWLEGGLEQRGILTKPEGCATPCTAPLVIQAFSADSTKFRPDGPSFSAFAVQSFAAAGFAVLQIPFAYEDQGSTFMTPAELPARVKRIDAVMQALRHGRVLSPRRIGLIGFSRSGYSAIYVLTHPGEVKIDASVIFDSITGGYGESVNAAALGDDSGSVFDVQYGVGNFWANKQAWLKEAPAFNLDRLQTPILFFSSRQTDASMAPALETIGAMRLMKKAFEYNVFPWGAHSLQRPRERLAAMQNSIAWMNFWLKDIDPADADQRNRWRALRELPK